MDTNAQAQLLQQFLSMLNGGGQVQAVTGAPVPALPIVPVKPVAFSNGDKVVIPWVDGERGLKLAPQVVPGTVVGLDIHPKTRQPIPGWYVIVMSPEEEMQTQEKDAEGNPVFNKDGSPKMKTVSHPLYDRTTAYGVAKIYPDNEYWRQVCLKDALEVQKNEEARLAAKLERKERYIAGLPYTKEDAEKISPQMLTAIISFFGENLFEIKGSRAEYLVKHQREWQKNSQFKELKEKYKGRPSILEEELAKKKAKEEVEEEEEAEETETEVEVEAKTEKSEKKTSKVSAAQALAKPSTKAAKPPEVRKGPKNGKAALAKKK